MELILVLPYLAFVLATASVTTVSDSDHVVGELACSNLYLLGNTVYEFAPVDKHGELSVGCTFLPDDYVPDVNRFLGEYTVDCVSHLCQINLLEVVHQGKVFYVAEGWLPQIDIDSFYHLLSTAVIEIDMVPCEVEGAKCQSYIQDKAIPIGYPFDRV